MEGEGERARDREMEIGSEKANTSALTRILNWADGLHSLVEVGYISSFIPLKNSLLFRPHFIDPTPLLFLLLLLFLFLHPLFPFPSLDTPLLFLPLLATYEGCSNTTCFLRHPPWEHYPTFRLLCFLSFPSFCLSPIYSQLDVCFPIDYFTEDMSGLCLCPVRLYIDSS